jgi:competence ComEA-like helix-hairpin-helix protein
VNRREQAVLLLVTAAFLAGIGISYCKRAGLRHRAALNLVAVVQDTSVGCSPDSAVAPPPVDLNQATPRQLDGLPGIGPVLAGRIVEYRQHKGGFRSVSELRAVSGIGEKRYSVLKDLVMVGSAGSTVDSGR